MHTYQPATHASSQAITQVNAFVRGVYNWMAIGLALTGFTAYYVAHTPALLEFVYRFFIVFAITEIGLVFFLSARIGKLQASTATAMFVIYAVLNGATFSYIFLMYTKALIGSVFFICAGAFAALSLFGWTTKKDLGGLGNFMFIGLIGIIIASIVNMFLKNSGMQMIISYIAVLVFAGLTAYDTQAIKRMAMSQPAGLDGTVVRKGAIMGALKLYLDFILMFQYLLHIFGGSRD